MYRQAFLQPVPVVERCTATVTGGTVTDVKLAPLAPAGLQIPAIDDAALPVVYVGKGTLVELRGREVARLNGIPVNRVRMGALVASGVIASCGGVLYAGVLGSADPYSGLNYLLPAFAAAFLGATTILPGRFNPWGAMVAVYFLATGITGLTMLGIPLWVTNVFNGGALIIAVTISQLTRGRETSDIG